MVSISVSASEYLLSSYAYDLPLERIAQHPAPRGSSRLLVVDRQSGERVHTQFAELAKYLPAGALLVANNSRVIPARLLGQRPTGGKMEFLLLTPMPLLEGAQEGTSVWRSVEAEGLLKPAKQARVGDVLEFGDDFRVEVLEKGDFGRHKVRLHWTGCLQTLFETRGHLPLPPYIHREDTKEDVGAYQTVYAREDKAGSVAAPTAGLHFTPAMQEQLAQAGFGWAEVTLHVGYGTFSPVRCADIRDHVMHAEFVELSPDTARAIQKAKAEGRPVLAVGTTSARTLEGIAQCYQPAAIPTAGHTGWINCFICPGYHFNVIDGLITNFHLPESTLLMLVSALTGRERMLETYAEAVQRKYRFFSYGDAMLIK
ncbi:MAG: tRNA preQ1(34) S-adenosylmethionine ribosyltransferase-isomerase QueA [Bilophila sp.]